MNSFDWFSKWNIYSPNSIAITDFDNDKSYTYSDLNHLSNQLAAHFKSEYKLGLGDRVAVLAENSIEYVVLFGVAQKLGIILIPLNYRLAAQELNYIIENSEPSLIIIQNSFLYKAEKTTAYGNVKFKLLLDELTNLQKSFCEPDNTEDITFTAITEDSPIFILYTSGTTAFPKGALYTHKMLFWNSINTELR